MMAASKDKRINCSLTLDPWLLPISDLKEFEKFEMPNNRPVQSIRTEKFYEWQNQNGFDKCEELTNKLFKKFKDEGHQ